MRVYVGQTRSAALARELVRAGIGECTVRGELDPRRRPFFHDNGAWRDFAAGRAFDCTRWVRDMWRMRDRAMRPDFVVVPDLVAGGLASLDVSAFWRDMVPDECPAYLAVQNGMSEGDVSRHLERFSYRGIFVGGDLEWKLATAPAWVRYAHDRGMACHVGRVGVADRVRWAHAIGADSIDSSLPLMAREHLVPFLDAVLAGDDGAALARAA